MAGWLSCFLLHAAERWELQYFYDKMDSHLAFVDLHFFSPARGVAVAVLLEGRRQKGIAALTSDGGRSWELLPLKEPPRTLFFLNHSTGWMTGQKGGVWTSSDGGRTWKRLRLHAVRALPVRVYFLDEARGWLLCEKKQVYVTGDGGHSWQLLETSRAPGVPEERTAYTTAAFSHQIGLLSGWTREGGLPARLPKWAEPQLIPLLEEATTAIMLSTLDGGETWTSNLLPDVGEIIRIRFSSAGQALMLVHRRDLRGQFLDPPSEATEIRWLDPKSLASKRLFADKNRWITDVTFAGGNRAFATAIDQEGRSPYPAIPSRLRVLTWSGDDAWSEMQVDYRAEARNAVLSSANPSSAWIATDTGMILRWVRE